MPRTEIKPCGRCQWPDEEGGVTWCFDTGRICTNVGTEDKCSNRRKVANGKES